MILSEGQGNFLYVPSLVSIVGLISSEIIAYAVTNNITHAILLDNIDHCKRCSEMCRDGLTDFWGESSVSSFQSIACVPKQTHWVSSGTQ